MLDPLGLIMILISEALDEFGWVSPRVQIVNVREVDHLFHALNQAVAQRLLCLIQHCLIALLASEELLLCCSSLTLAIFFA